MKPLRKFILPLTLLLALSLAAPIKAFATNTALSTKKYEWYFKPAKDGKQPQPMSEAAFFKKYNAHYIGPPDEKVIYLTFDTGYNNGYTEEILKVLKAHQVPAAFFVTGYLIEKEPDFIRRIADDGHLVCNHSQHHKDMAKITDFEQYAKELKDVEAAYEKATGRQMPKFYRPPMGSFSELSLKYDMDLGYHTIFWSFAYVDWYDNKQPSHEYAISKILSRTHPGAVVLLHSTSKTNAEILDKVLTEWKKQGYTFKTLYDLVKAKKPD